MLMLESRSEIISSGVTPTRCPNRTSFSTTCSKRTVSLSSKPLDWLPSVDCGEFGVAIRHEISAC